ncbi:MAG: hypothetical protein WC829_24390 [Hyphomicrobium sp.]|jgi:hypothetical protein
MNEAHRIRIERVLQDIDTWRASGMKLSSYALSRGEELSYWRAQLSWERRWRQMLNGTYTQARVAFVRATPGQTRSTTKSQPQSPQHSAQPQTSLRIVINVQGGALQASVEWPLNAASSSSAWLREVLA